MNGPANEGAEIRPIPPPKLGTGITAQGPPDKSAIQQGGWRRKLLTPLLCCCFLLLTGCGLISFFIYTCFSPTDRVQVTLIEIPSDVDRACVGSKSGGSTRLMALYRDYGFASVSSENFIRLQHRFVAEHVTYDVAWRSGDRYVVYVGNRDGKWLAVRFEPNEAAIEGRLPVIGGGRVTFDLSKGKIEMLSEETAKELGLVQRN
jgi:hypothetical protein